MAKIIGARLLDDLYRLRKFGEYKTGVHRPTYSEDDMAARHWFASRLTEAGHEASIDGIGNVIGRSPANGRKLLIGSHLESQPHAGWLDGALGAIYGLEVARAIAEDPDLEDVGVDVAGWADEEGHFKSFIGSRSFIGDLSDTEIDGLANKYDGGSLRAALANAGLGDRARILGEPSRHIGFLEAHIEQGDSLESTGLKIGVVTSVVSICQYKIVAVGVQNHAGTTRMAIRKDAGLALIRLASAIDRRFPEIAAERSVWTIGDLKLEPGAGSIIPGRGEMLFQFRDADPAQLARFEDELRRLVDEANAESPCDIELETIMKTEPKIMDDGFQRAFERAAERHAPGLHVRMPSGAGHDAQILAEAMPSAMMFIPSIGGVSHHWTEDTSDDDIVLGCQVMASAAAELLMPLSPAG